MKTILLFTLLLMASPSLFGQYGTLTGKVINQKGQPVAFANVYLEGRTSGSSTDDEGKFIIKNVTTGKQTVLVSAIGYQGAKQVVAISAGQTTTIDFSIVADARYLQSVEIIGRDETSYKNTRSFIGTKSGTALIDVPQSIGYVTKELALDQGAFRVNDVVKNISGVNQFSFYNDITIRGHRIQGQRSSGNLTNGMRAFTSFWKQQLIPHIERVEVMKGPASALFGNASAGGTINRVTKKPLAEQRQSISATVGSFNTFRTLADFTGAMTEDKTLLYRLNLGYENSGSFRDLQYDKNLVVAPSFSFLPTEKTRLNIDLVYQGSDGRLDRGQAVFGDGDLYSAPISKSLSAMNDYLKEENVNVTVSLNHKFSDKLSFNSIYMRSSYREDLQEHRTANTFASLGDGSRDPEKVEMRVFIRERKWNNDNFNNYFNYNFNIGRVENSLLVGWDYFQQVLEPGGSQLEARGYLNADKTGAINSFDASKPENYALDSDGNPIPNVPHFDLTDPFANQIRELSKYFYTTRIYAQSKLYSNGIYIQNQVKIGKLQVLLGLRQEFYNDVLNFKSEQEESVEQDALIPRLGLVYSLTPQLNVYGTWVRGFQPQTASVVNDPNAGGPFDPLTSELFEAGLKSEWFEGKLSTSMAIFHLTDNGALYPANDPNNADLQVQIGEEVSKGVELDIAGSILPNWSVVASYSFNDATITQSDTETEIGRQKPNAPKHTANIWTKYIFGKGSLRGLGFGLGANYVDERYGSIVSTDTPPVFPSYQLVDAAVYYKLEKFQVQLNINNVFDKTHWVGGYDYLRAFPGSPRNVMTTIAYTF
ncbi:TonB-dependent receptor [Flammeovirgaceae bacterium SG7u.111]|nr:TonB-dependent receptor [Flammeovirgaceae bacterium SG7u.132]WPO37091.1 TonB-dependent receptor [Flammeovirgaceae bacterium SG7u.111]